MEVGDTLGLATQASETHMVAIFECLAHPNRLRIIRLLLGGERTVEHLVADMPVLQATVSHHLGVLVAAGLVVGKKKRIENRRGHFTSYRLVVGVHTQLGKVMGNVTKRRDT